MQFERLTGLIAASFTPLHQDGTLHLEQIGPLVEHLAANRVKAIYAIGSTGEGQSLSLDERKQVAEETIRAASGKLPVILQVGHNSLVDAKHLARHGASIGAAAISATAPSYFKPTSIETLVASMAEIAGGAPELPFYYYHIPMLVGLQLDLPQFLLRAADSIPNFVGVKYTAATIWEFQACRELDSGRFDCVYGHDEMLLPALAVGAQAAIGSTYNFAAPIYHRVVAAFREGDLKTAQQAQGQAIKMIQVLIRHGGLPAIKAAMKLIGVDCGPVRLPLAQPKPAEIETLRSELEQVGFFQAIGR